MKQIEDLLRQTIGLHAATIGPTLVEHSVRARMSALRLARTEDYLQLLRASHDEWHHLVDLVIVSETWFFRDCEPFRALTQLVQSEWLAANTKDPLRILSLPCSTGEEPYSIAMALLDAGIPAAGLRIDAFDLSPISIARAQCAEYGKNSFRGKDLAFRARHFKPTAKGHQLNPDIRSAVRFQTGNLLDAQLLAETSTYDFIFCRNLLIYFDRPTQERALHKLARLLTPAGVLFVGSAEVTIATQNGFDSAHFPLSFACRKTSHAPVVANAKKSLNANALAPLPVPFTTSALGAPVNLEKARQLANEGRLAEAAEICETCLRQHGASADAYYLLGLVRDAAGAESQAGEFYRKALYLEPNHYETLVQWATLSEKTGDDAHARILLERAGRLKPPGWQPS